MDITPAAHADGEPGHHHLRRDSAAPGPRNTARPPRLVEARSNTISPTGAIRWTGRVVTDERPWRRVSSEVVQPAGQPAPRHHPPDPSHEPEGASTYIGCTKITKAAAAKPTASARAPAPAAIARGVGSVWRNARYASPAGMMKKKIRLSRYPWNKDGARGVSRADAAPPHQ